MVNDHFTLVSIINSGFLVLVPENSFLTFNIPYTSPKTGRVYFGVLQRDSFFSLSFTAYIGLCFDSGCIYSCMVLVFTKNNVVHK